ncbi:MAG: ABC transporter ATP-binding protein [Gemmatimonadota bacterium]|nr:ABC transporter ATP-binding protein [Gemmatimonadota bacterium]
MSAALSTHHLVKHYRAGACGKSDLVRALDGVSIDVDEGEIVGVAGARGAGKSTLLLCAAGLVRPDAGCVRWFGARLDPPALPPGIAYVPQRSTYYSFLTVREALEYYATLHELGTRERASQVEHAVREVALSDHVTRRVGCLAPPLLKRLGLAQALIGAPRALLLDETLDGELTVCLEIRALLRRLSERGAAILIAAEDPARLSNIAHRVVRIAAGRMLSRIETAGFANTPPSRNRRIPLQVS